MKAYEDHLYEMWKDQVEAVLPGLLKKNLLVKPSAVAAREQPAQTEAEDPDKDPEAGELLLTFVILLMYYSIE